MIRFWALSALAGGLLLGSAALAADLDVEISPPAPDAPSRAYATVFAGASLPHAHVTAFDDEFPVGLTFDLEFDVGYILGGAVGTTVLPNLRGEIEFSVVQSTLSNFFDEEVEATSTGYNLLGNLWYDVDTGTSFMPYIGGGVGYGHTITFNGVEDEVTTSGLLYQLGAGVRVAATENIGFDLGYRYRVQPDAEVGGDIEVDLDGGSVTSSATNHIVHAGVTVGF